MERIIAQNKKAWHDYFIEDTYEAGIELCGTEVKSIRAGRVNLKDSYASISGYTVFIKGMHISPYEQGNIYNKDPLRERRLLMHKSEIRKINSTLMEKGLTLIPLKLYFKGSLVKVLLGIARGKKLYDKRDAIAAKDAKRNVDRAIKEQFRG
jgi:SsrA-binding protein